MSEVKNVVVIGGSSGLGKVVAQLYASKGCHVAIVSRNKPALAQGQGQASLDHFSADLIDMSASSAGRLAADVIAKLGYINYLIFCQRYRGQERSLATEMAVSVTATDHLIQAFRRHFQHSQDCAIAAVSSVYADVVGSSQPLSYHVAKAGVNALIRYYAVTLGNEGIRANAIAPLTYLKDESKHVYTSNPQMMYKYHRLVPLNRMPTADECADAIAYLCSPQASFVNGQILYVDGGVSAVWPEELV